MIKKIITLLAIISVSAIFAQEATSKKDNPPSPNHSGLYLGVEGGPSSLTSNINLKYTVSAAGVVDTTKENLGVLGGFVAGYIGYGCQFDNNIYLSLEGYVGGPDLKLDIKHRESSGSTTRYSKYYLQREMFYGITPMVGYFFKNTFLLHIDLGIEGAKWEGEAKLMLATTTTSLSKTSSTEASFVPGIGLTAFFTDHFYMTIGYKVAIGPDIKLNDFSFTSGNDSVVASVKFDKTYENRAKLALGYQF
jgi:hypothetical protein